MQPLTGVSSKTSKRVDQLLMDLGVGLRPMPTTAAGNMDSLSLSLSLSLSPCPFSLSSFSRLLARTFSLPSFSCSCYRHILHLGLLLPLPLLSSLLYILFFS